MIRDICGATTLLFAITGAVMVAEAATSWPGWVIALGVGGTMAAVACIGVRGL